MADQPKIEQGYKITIFEVPGGRMLMNMEIEETAAETVDIVIRTFIESHQKKKRRSRMKLED